MTKTVVFGAGRYASLIWHALTDDSDMSVAAFTVDAEFLTTQSHHGLPVIAFESLREAYPPDDFNLVIGAGYVDRNRLRAERFAAARAMGYQCPSYVSSRAIVPRDLDLGANCLVFDGVILQPFCEIGDNVTIRAGATVSHHCRIADHAFISVGATLAGNVEVGARSFIGAGATVRDGIKIGAGSFIGAGAVVLGDTTPGGVYLGNPARRQSESA